MEEINLGELLNKLIIACVSYGKTLIVAIIIISVGLWIIKHLTKTVKKLFAARNVDATLTSFVLSLINIALKILLFISVITYVGVPMTSFVAILGAASLAVGMALQGTLQNFAGGVMLLLFRPFKVGDFVELKGYSGVVNEIQIFNTVITTGDNKIILIPNGGISTDSMVNYSRMPQRRVDLEFGIGYGDDIDAAYAAIKNVIDRNDLILKDPEPFMAVSSLGDNSVNIVVRIWCATADYWTVFFYMNEFVKKEFDKQNISIPFPQRDVHIIKD